MRDTLDIQKTNIELPVLLIIDDSDEVVDFISELFSEDYQCIKAVDGQDGINKANELVPDIILCDVQMPKKSGLDVVRELKSNTRTRLIPIILLSGYNTRENRLQGLRAMADDFIAKPFDFEELRIKMSNLLNIRKQIPTNTPENIIQKELGLETQSYKQVEHRFLERIIEYFVLNFSEKTLNVQNLAQHMEISVRQLQRNVKKITSESPMDLLRFYRLRQSAQLLLRHKSIAEVAEACGFRSPNYFCTCFKNYFKVTPSHYQKSH